MKKQIIFFLLFCVSVFGAYDPAYYEFSKTSGIDTAILMTAYNRVDYFKSALEAIAENPESQEIALFFFLDGGPEAKQKELTAVIASFAFPHAHIIARDKNLGCEKNIIDSRRFMFDHCQFDKVIIMEDDHVIAPNGISTILKMYEWGKKEIDRFGAVTLWSDRKLSKENKSRFLSVLTEPYRKKTRYTANQGSFYTLPLYWVFCLDREVWDDIKDFQYEYERLFIHTPKFDRSKIPAIHKWERQRLVRSKKFYEKTDSRIAKIIGDPLSVPTVPFQDGATDVSLREKGYRYVVPAVNRMENIGVYGLHFTPHLWKKLCSNLCLDVFEQDLALETFQFVPYP